MIYNYLFNDIGLQIYILQKVMLLYNISNIFLLLTIDKLQVMLYNYLCNRSEEHTSELQSR